MLATVLWIEKENVLIFFMSTSLRHLCLMTRISEVLFAYLQTRIDLLQLYATLKIAMKAVRTCVNDARVPTLREIDFHYNFQSSLLWNLDLFTEVFSCCMPN